MHGHCLTSCLACKHPFVLSLPPPLPPIPRPDQFPSSWPAFDIYNKRTGRFASVAERNRRLEGLDIPIAPLVARQRFGGEAELRALLDTQSAFYDGFVEGCYLRIDGEEHNEHRGKIVRPDFMQNITTHWSHQFVKNTVQLY